MLKRREIIRIENKSVIGMLKMRDISYVLPKIDAFNESQVTINLRMFFFGLFCLLLLLLLLILGIDIKIYGVQFL
jgi:uncharacterized membrane protein